MRVDFHSTIPKAQSVEVEKKELNSEEIAIEKSKEMNFDEDSGLRDTVSVDFIDKTIEKANESLEVHNKRVEREVHEETNRMTFKIIDTETEEVIKEIPPEKIQDMIAKIWELAGLFVDERA